jgi:predicted MFS family arabinose efflux permease
MNMGAQTGSAITAWLTPYIGEHFGWSMSFLVAAVLCAGGAAAWFFVNPEYREMRHRNELLEFPPVQPANKYVR